MNECREDEQSEANKAADVVILSLISEELAKHPSAAVSAMEERFRIIHRSLKDTVPAGVRLSAFKKIIKRHWWLSPLFNWEDEAIKRDLRRLRGRAETLRCVDKLQKDFLDEALPIPTPADQWRICLAIATQVAATIAIVVFRDDLDWAIFAQAVALAMAAPLVGKCTGINQLTWLWIMTGATFINLAITAVVMILKSKHLIR